MVKDAPIYQRYNGRWYYDITDEFGKRLRKSLKLPANTSKRTAIAKYYQIVIDGETLTIEAAANLVCDRLENMRDSKTIKKYRTAFAILDKYCQSNRIRSLEQVSAKHISNMFSIYAQSRQPSTTNSIRLTIKSMLNRLNDWGYMPHDYDSVKWFSSSIQKVEKRERIYSQIELQALFNDQQFGHIYRLLYLTGARSGELIAVHSSNVSEKTITFPYTKRGSTRKAPLSPDAAQYIRDSNTKEGYLIWQDTWGDPTKESIRLNAQRRILRRLNKILKDNNYQPGRVHDIRATTATHLSQTVSPFVLQKIMGWQTIATAESYCRQKAEDIYFPELPAAKQAVAK